MREGGVASWYSIIFKRYEESGCSGSRKELLEMFKNEILQGLVGCTCGCHYSGGRSMDPVGDNGEFHRFTNNSGCDKVDAELCSGRKDIIAELCSGRKDIMKTPEPEMAKYGVEITPELEKTAQDAPAVKECGMCHRKIAEHVCPEALNP